MDLRSHILIQLATSERIVRDGDEVVPRFTIVTPEGPHIVVAQLPDGEKEHAEQLFVVRAFMIWKAASGFTFANKLISRLEFRRDMTGAESFLRGPNSTLTGGQNTVTLGLIYAFSSADMK